jgi:hypothetical protein
MTQLLTLLITLTFSLTAYASNFSGFASLFIALPLLILSNLIIGLFFIFRPSRWQKTFAKVLFTPTILICTIIFFIDALPLIGQVEVLNPDNHGLLFYFGYIALFGLLVYLLKKLIKRPLFNDN